MPTPRTASATTAPPRHLVTISEAALRLSVSPRTIHRYIASGRLRAKRVGPRMLRVELADVDGLVRPVAAAPQYAEA
jgi:excisionase family DNA binding protein